MIRIISFKICPFVQRVTALLEAKEMEYRVDYISLKDKPEWFLALSPTGQVPVLVTEGGEALFESDAIAEYLDEIAPPLEPGISPEARARNRAWSYQASKHYLAQCSAQRSGDAEALEARSAPLRKAFARAEEALGAGPFFNGERLGNVDIAWLVLLHRAAIIRARAGYDFLAGFPKVQAWQRALLATGLAERSVAEDFEAAFAGFYLSEETYLGRGCEGEARACCGASGCC